MGNKQVFFAKDERAYRVWYPYKNGLGTAYWSFGQEFESAKSAAPTHNFSLYMRLFFLKPKVICPTRR